MFLICIQYGNTMQTKVFVKGEKTVSIERNNKNRTKYTKLKYNSCFFENS